MGLHRKCIHKTVQQFLQSHRRHLPIFNSRTYVVPYSDEFLDRFVRLLARSFGPLIYVTEHIHGDKRFVVYGLQRTKAMVFKMGGDLELHFLRRVPVSTRRVVISKSLGDELLDESLFDSE